MTRTLSRIAGLAAVTALSITSAAAWAAGAHGHYQSGMVGEIRFAR